MRHARGAELGRRAPALAVVVAALAVTAPLWIRRGVVASPWSDVVVQFLSLRELAHRAFAAGRLPLWNPHMNGGAPALANPQSNYLFPLDLLVTPLAPERGIALLFVANVVLAGLSMWALARRVLQTTGAALFAAVSYALAWRYLVMIQVGWLPRMTTYALAPLLFLAVRTLVRAPSRRGTVAFAAIVALLLFQGDLQPTYYAALAAIGYAAWELAGAPRAARAPAAAGLALGGSLGVLLASPAWLPAAQYAVLSTRSKPDYAFFLHDPPALAALATLVDPRTEGGTRAGFWENNFYFGVAVVPLALLGVARGGRRARALGAAALLGVALCFDSPLLRAAFEAVPGFGMFRQSPRVLLLVQLALVLLAACGLDTALRVLASRGRAALAAAALACAVPVADAALRISPSLATTPVARVAPRTVFHDDLARVSSHGGRTAAIGRGVVPYGMAGWYGIDLVNGYAGLTLQHWIEYFSILQFGTRDAIPKQPVVWTDLRAVARPDLLRALDVERIVAEHPVDLSSIGFDPLAHHDSVPVFAFYEGEKRVPVEVYAARAPLGPAYFASAVDPVADAESSLQALVDTRSPRRAHVLGLDRHAPVAPAGARASLVQRGVDRFVYATESSGDGFLVLAQVWYPGWELTIDGAPAPLWRTNHALLGTVVPGGQHRVELVMTSPALGFGALLAGAALLGCVAVLFVGRRRERADGPKAAAAA